MSRFNTGNPLGSEALQDLSDNAKNFDCYMNSKEGSSWRDRLGSSRKTVHSMEMEFKLSQEERENRFNNFISSSGYVFIGDYSAGLVINEYNQIVRDEDGMFWRASGSVELPYTLTGEGVDEGGSLVSVGDAYLRQQLDGPKGSSMVGFFGETIESALVGRVSVVEGFSDLISTTPRKAGEYIAIREYYRGGGCGGGLYRSTRESSPLTVGEGDLVWELVVTNREIDISRLGANQDDPVSTARAFEKAIECVRYLGGGTVSFPLGEWRMWVDSGMLAIEVNTSDIGFKIPAGSHLILKETLLGWYPTGVGTGYKNISFFGGGVIEQIPGTQWHNDFVYVDGINVRNLTFINPITTGHFIDSSGSKNIDVINIKVLGSGIESAANPRRYSEFIQVAEASDGGIGWVEKREKYKNFMDGSPSESVSLKDSLFATWGDGEDISFPPRPIGNHGSNASLRRSSGFKVTGCEFYNISQTDEGARSYFIEVPYDGDVLISGNKFYIGSETRGGGASNNNSFVYVRGGNRNSRVVISGNQLLSDNKSGYSQFIGTSDVGNLSIINNYMCSSDSTGDLIVDYGAGNSYYDISNNIVKSAGRRFIYSTGEYSKTHRINGNNILFTTAPDDRRNPIYIAFSSVSISDNIINHPSMGFEIGGGSRGIISSNLLLGNSVSWRLTDLIRLFGNVFMTTGNPNILASGKAVESTGWNFTK